MSSVTGSEWESVIHDPTKVPSISTHMPSQFSPQKASRILALEDELPSQSRAWNYKTRPKSFVSSSSLYSQTPYEELTEYANMLHDSEDDAASSQVHFSSQRPLRSFYDAKAIKST